MDAVAFAFHERVVGVLAVLGDEPVELLPGANVVLFLCAVGHGDANTHLAIVELAQPCPNFSTGHRPFSLHRHIFEAGWSVLLVRPTDTESAQ